VFLSPTWTKGLRGRVVARYTNEEGLAVSDHCGVKVTVSMAV